MKADHILAFPLKFGQRVISARLQAGFSMLELLLVVAIGSVMVALALPNIQTTMSNIHLGSSASSLSQAIQSSRFLAVSTGCPIQLTISAQNYQIWAEQLTITSGNTPACASTYTYWCANASGPPLHYSTTACTIPYTTSDISTTSASTVQANGTVISSLTLPYILQLNPNGIVSPATTGTATPVATNFSFGLTQLRGSATRLVLVSGVGNVKIQ